MNVKVFNGSNGGAWLNDGATHDPVAPQTYFFAVQIIADTVFASSTVVNIPGLAASNVIFPAGTILYGKWGSITLTSGTAIAYYP